MCDGDTPAERSVAMDELTGLIRSGRCHPAVAVLKGTLQVVNLADSTRDVRRTRLKLFRARYVLDITLWF